MAENEEKYTHPKQFSTSQLEELLRMDLEESGPESWDTAFTILELLERRTQGEAAANLPDVDRAWEDFQTYYDLPEGENQSLYPQSKVEACTQARRPTLRRLLQYGLAAVLAVAALFGGLLAAQAAGADVFGAIGRWTEETFHFVVPSNESNPDHQKVQEDLTSGSVAESLPPTWYPDGLPTKEP